MTAIPAVQVIIQARIGSSRLPGKALLPIAGLPAAVLCAKRAAHHCHYPVTVALPDIPQDDPLADALSAHGITVMRGPYEDVLARFIAATKLLPDTGWVVRLTADNMVPDGDFINELVATFASAQANHGPKMADYMSTLTEDSPLPYGVTAEIITVAALRHAQQHATTATHREHVTAYTRQHGRIAPYTPPTLGKHAGHLRATMDTKADYTRLQHLFSNISNPITIPWQQLCHHLADLPDAPAFTVPHGTKQGRRISALSLGTVQFGLPYGIANTHGQPNPATIQNILSTAISYGITCIDTAAAYGDAEARLGECLPPLLTGQQTIVTKLSPLADLPDDAPAATVAQQVTESIQRSCQLLQQPTLPYVLLHRWQHRHSHNGALWQALQHLKTQGVIGNLGVSVSTPTEALSAMADPDIKWLQLPVNLLDFRWHQDNWLTACAQRPDVIIQARSSLLQGLLANPSSPWPSNSAPADKERVIAALTTWVSDFNRDSWADLAFAYVRSLPWVDTVVVGVETDAQLRQNLQLFTSPCLTPAQCHTIWQTFHQPSNQLPQTLLNPAHWQK